MKIFLSWSGVRSKAVAELLSDWIRCVIQASRPWISARDIDRGALWFSEINDQLKEVTVGIVCLTQSNKNKPWILFEAGAMAKGLASSRVCTFLIDLQPADIEDPLAQFNHTLPEKDSMRQLVRTLNTSCGQSALDDRVLDQVFDTYWPQFEEKFSSVIRSHVDSEKSKPRDEKSVLAEILETTRMLNHRVRKIEVATEERSISSRYEEGISSPMKIRKTVKMLVSEGRDPQTIINLTRGMAPSAYLKQEIERALIEKESEVSSKVNE